MTGEVHLEAALAASRSDMRRALVERRFVDDGEMLRGPVRWVDENGYEHRASVDIRIPPAYPFAPPQVELLDAGRELVVTFHCQSDGMCLWDSTEPVAGSPWTDAVLLLDRVAGWLHNTAAGWPDDDDCDLERYVSGATRQGIVLYDRDALRGMQGYVKTTSEGDVRTVHAQPTVPPGQEQRRGGKRAKGPVRVSTAQRHMAFVADLGPVAAPIVSWRDVEAAVGDSSRELRSLIQQGHVDLLMLWYQRGVAQGLLALAVSPAKVGQPIKIQAYESADSSLPTRTLRSGDQADALAAKRVAIVGCGAVGSHVADLLFKDGVKALTLVDYQILRPGNIVRHASPTYFVGFEKAVAVRAHLRGIGLDVSRVVPVIQAVRDPRAAEDLLSKHDLVIDATADQRATDVMWWVASQLGRPFLTGCVQREGGIVRADRLPITGEAAHLPTVPPLSDSPQPLKERGCGDTVSRTPPSAVVAAAELIVGMARAILLDQPTAASMIRVIARQPDPPYDTLRMLVSEAAQPGVTT